MFCKLHDVKQKWITLLTYIMEVYTRAGMKDWYILSQVNNLLRNLLDPLNKVIY